MDGGTARRGVAPLGPPPPNTHTHTHTHLPFSLTKCLSGPDCLSGPCSFLPSLHCLCALFLFFHFVPCWALEVSVVCRAEWGFKIWAPLVAFYAHCCKGAANHSCFLHGHFFYFCAAWLLHGWWWWLLELVIICRHGTNRCETKLMEENVDSLKGKKWILNCFFWWPLQSQIVGGWLGVTWLSLLLVCITPCFIRFISFGHRGWPGCVASVHELWN